MTKVDDAAFVFLDTNLPLHCKRADQIDWCALAGRTPVTLVVALVVLRELQKQAIHNPKRKLRERADATLRWMNELLDHAVHPAPIRPGVDVLFLTAEPQIDLGKHRLSEQVADDQLIASALELQAQIGRAVQIATRDIALKLKLMADASRPGVLWMPDEFLLPNDPDPIEKENEELRRKVTKYEARFPSFRVTGPDGAQPVQFTRQRRRLPAADMRAKVRADHPKKPAAVAETTIAPNLSRRLKSMAQAEIIAVERINERIDLYYAEYDSYLEQLADWLGKNDLCYGLTLEVVNEGTFPATDIDVVVTLPDGVSVIDPSDRPKPPKAPLAPGKVAMPDIPDHLFRPPVPAWKRYPVFKDNTVRFPVERLKHGFTSALDMVVLSFASDEAVGSFTARVEISCEELPEPQEHDLHIVIAEPTKPE
jgi:hypothetical protein